MLLSGAEQLKQGVLGTPRDDVDVQTMMQNDNPKAPLQALSYQLCEFRLGVSAVAALRCAMGEIQHNIGGL